MIAQQTENKTKSRALIFVISGPSGSGKTTLLEKLLETPQIKKLLKRSISFTTRPKRKGEISGKDYLFINRQEFERLRLEQKILEWTKYLGYYYGTPRDLVEAYLKGRKSVALCLDTAGAKHIKRAYPRRAVTIFIAPPSLEELRQRIHVRGRETRKSEIDGRLAIAEHEIAQARDYDHCLINDDFKKALNKLKRIVLLHIKDTHKKQRGKNALHGIGRHVEQK